MNSYLSTCIADSNGNCQIQVNVSQTHANGAGIFLSNLSIAYSAQPENIVIDLGNDGTTDWTFTGKLNSTNSPMKADLSLGMADAIKNSTKGFDGSSNISIAVRNAGKGTIQLDSFNVSYIPDIWFNNTEILLDNVLDSLVSLNFTPNSGTLEVNNLDFSYYGTIGYNITGKCGSSTDTKYLNVYFSNFTLAMPRHISYFEITPTTNNSKNLQPLGQKSNIPIFNISSLGYSTGMNVSVKLNSTLNSCISLNISTTYNQSSATILNTSNNVVYTNLTYKKDFGIFAWTNLNNCNATAYRYFEPIFVFDSCCVSCLPCW